MTDTNLGRELEAARTAARNAGAAIMRYYGATEWESKLDSSPVTVADHASNSLITESLREAFPDDGILAEESADSSARLAATRVWIIDPLDGTKEFLAQNGEFSVLIGLAIDGAACLGVVYLPATDVLYSAAKGEGSWVERGGERKRLSLTSEGSEAGVRLVGSRSHPEPFLVRMQEAFGITDVVPCGSVGVKCSRIVDGDRDLYVHPVAYLKEWDTCAPEVILVEAGGRVTDCTGEALRYNKPNPVQPHGIVAAAPGVLGTMHDDIAAMYAGGRKDPDLSQPRAS